MIEYCQRIWCLNFMMLFRPLRSFKLCTGHQDLLKSTGFHNYSIFSIQYSFYSGGGERGIRTLGAAFDSTHDFQSCSFSQLGHLSVFIPRPRRIESIRSRHGPRSSNRSSRARDSWRRGWDSNPRSRLWQDTAFREQGLQPLGHLSR